MKVQDINLTSHEMQPRAPAERQATAQAGLAFSRQLTSLSEESYYRRINDMVVEITKQGELLSKRADIKELQKYREMITELLHETVSNSFAFTKNNAFDARGRHRVYAMIKRVNADLDAIAQELLKEQTDNIQILDLVDDIRGLLVDIFL